MAGSGYLDATLPNLVSNPFFDSPILNSPYEYPSKHWELDAAGQPTQRVVDERRSAKFISPIPKPRKKTAQGQANLALDEGAGLSTGRQLYDATSMIGEVRRRVDQWRAIKNPANWNVTPETQRLLEHWRSYAFANVRPFFCQVEAAETAIWLTEVAPHDANGRRILEHLKNANAEANPLLHRIALKLATGAGKTTVMAMIIAWQTINAVRRPQGKRFTRAFLITTPGITIKDRLRVLQPNDPDNYYQHRELVPRDMLVEIGKAKIVITNYHAYKLRETLELAKGSRALLQGRTGEALQTTETPGQMLQRVMPELMGFKNILAINDEAHHCYRERSADDEPDLKSEEKKEAEENNEAARLWISGLEMVNKTLGLNQVWDLSATPFFLRGSGYAEGTLFPWTMSDFSLMDAIECGIVKLPRVPIAENIPGDEMPTFRNLWENIRDEMPKKSAGKAIATGAVQLPIKLQTAIEALYGHYEKTYQAWAEKKIPVPPCFIIVCQNTAVSRLVYEFISGYQRANDKGELVTRHQGHHALFRNFDDNGNALPRPNSLLIDSSQLESGEGLDDSFRAAAGDEIERFKRERRQRGIHHTEISDEELLREVMNTVGKPGTLGGHIRCVVSVSMLTEGWDANTVTHVLGVRAFGTQLLCEQVIGRALRRQSYDLNERKLFNVEYADVLGIPFDFTAKPTIVKPVDPIHTVAVKAIRPERDALEIRFPNVEGYSVQLPDEKLEATFTPETTFELTPEIVGPTRVQMSGIIGQTVNLDVGHLDQVRQATIAYELTRHLLDSKFRDEDGAPKLYLFGQLKRIVTQWLNECLVCKGGTFPAQLLYLQLADLAVNRIHAAISQTYAKDRPVFAEVSRYNPVGSSADVRFNTSRPDLWLADSRKCQVNYVVYDSGWEAEFCRVLEAHPQVHSYVKNHNLGLEVPYRYGPEKRRYFPDFIVRVDDGHGYDDLLNLIVEIKGYRREDAKEKKLTMDSFWIPGVNNLGAYGRWAFAELRDVWELESDFEAKIRGAVDEMVESVVGAPA
jgi:type III restriction enzyme